MSSWFKRLVLPIAALVTFAVFALASPEPSIGLYYYFTGDPTTGAGQAAPQWQIGIRTDVPTIFYKCGAANTAWCTIAGGGAVFTNSAPANVLIKSDGVNGVASAVTDDGSANLILNRNNIEPHTFIKNADTTDPLPMFVYENIYQAKDAAGTFTTISNETIELVQRTVGSVDGHYILDIVSNSASYDVLNCQADPANAGKVTCQLGQAAATTGEFFLGGNPIDMPDALIVGLALDVYAIGNTGHVIGCPNGVCTGVAANSDSYTFGYNLEVIHNAIVDNELDVKSTLFFYPGTSALENGDFYFEGNGRMRQSGGTAAITSGCGTGASIQGGPLAGTILFGTGPGSCVLTFANTFGVTPSLVVSCYSGTGIAYTPAAATLTFTATGRAGDSCSWMVVGNG